MFYKIINSCKYVMNKSKFVKINYNKLDLFINKINCNDLRHWLSNNPYNLFDLGIEKLINFMLLYDSINYSFWGNPKWNIDTKDGNKDGSDALLYVMLNYVKESNNLDFTKVSFLEFKNMLKGNGEIPYIKERYKKLVKVSNIVNLKMHGNFYKYIYNIKNDSELFNVIIKNFPVFKDERKYDGKKVYFYKLAQLLTSDILHLRKLLENVGVNYSHLVGCADYKIPQVMRALGIIEYSNELSNLVDNGKEITYSSKYEVEIRASVIVIINYIKDKLKKENSIDINDYFFILSKELKDNVRPYHKCRNENY